MDPIFPLTREPLLNGFRETLQDGVLRSEFDTGPPETRLVSTLEKRDVNASYIVTNTERNDLITFYEEEIFQGVKNFEITLNEIDYVAQLTGPLAFNPIGGGLWSVNINLITIRTVVT